LADYADLHLALIPGTNVALFNAMAACIIEEQLFDREFVAQRVAGFEQFVAHISVYSAEKSAGICGVAASDIRAAARLYARQSRAMSFHGLGLTEHHQGTDAVMALINLALLCGHLGKPSSGINPLRGQNNVQGAAQMGCEPTSLTGGQDIQKCAAKFESVWACKLPRSDGMNLMAMMDAARTGQFKALWAIGFDLYQTLANADQTALALKQLDLLIVQDLFLTETARAFAHVFLPAASVFERDGTFMNSDRRVQRVRRVVTAPGLAQSDSWIVAQLAARMGHQVGFEFDDAEAKTLT
jgi:formate dehydrogenase major subunit